MSRVESQLCVEIKICGYTLRRERHLQFGLQKGTLSQHRLIESSGLCNCHRVWRGGGWGEGAGMVNISLFSAIRLTQANSNNHII